MNLTAKIEENIDIMLNEMRSRPEPLDKKNLAGAIAELCAARRQAAEADNASATAELLAELRKETDATRLTHE